MKVIAKTSFDFIVEVSESELKMITGDKYNRNVNIVIGSKIEVSNIFHAIQTWRERKEMIEDSIAKLERLKSSLAKIGETSVFTAPSKEDMKNDN